MFRNRKRFIGLLNIIKSDESTKDLLIREEPIQLKIHYLKKPKMKKKNKKKKKTKKGSKKELIS